MVKTTADARDAHVLSLHRVQSYALAAARRSLKAIEPDSDWVSRAGRKPRARPKA